MLVLEKENVDLMSVKLEKRSVNSKKSYFVNAAENGTFPVTKEFYEELEFLFKRNSVVFKDYLRTMFKILPDLIAVE